jgi:hypothetical protein
MPAVFRVMPREGSYWKSMEVRDSCLHCVMTQAIKLHEVVD